MNNLKELDIKFNYKELDDKYKPSTITEKDE